MRHTLTVALIAYILLPGLVLWLAPAKLPVTLIGLGVTVLAGLFHQTLFRLAAWIARPAQVFAELPAALARYGRNLQLHNGDLRARTGMADPHILYKRLLTMLVFLVTLPCIAYVEGYLVVETALGFFAREGGAASMIGLDVLEPYFPVLLAVSCIAACSLAGILLGESYRQFSLTPIHDLDDEQRRNFRSWTLAAIITLLSAMLLMALYRGLSILPLAGSAPMTESGAAVDLSMSALTMDAAPVGPAIPAWLDFLLVWIPVLVNLLLATGFMVLILQSKWMLEPLSAFPALAIATVFQLVLAFAYVVTRLLQAFPVEFILGPVLSALEALLRMARLVASPLAALLDPDFIEPDALLYPATQAAETRDTDSQTQASGPDENPEQQPVMTISNETSPDQDHNWNPYR